MPDCLEGRTSLKNFSDLAARMTTNGTLTGHGDAEQVAIVRKTANLVPLWGLRPVGGRLPAPGEGAPGRAPVAVLSHHYWQKAFSGDASAIGSTVFVDGRPV